MAIEYDVGLLYGRRLSQPEEAELRNLCDNMRDFDGDALYTQVFDLGVIHNLPLPDGTEATYVGYKAVEMSDVLHTLVGVTEFSALKLDTNEMERKWRDLVDEAYDNFLPSLIYNWFLRRQSYWADWTMVLYVTVR